MDTHFLVSCLFVSEPPLQSPPLVHVLLIFISVSFFIFSSPLPAEVTITDANGVKSFWIVNTDKTTPLTLTCSGLLWCLDSSPSHAPSHAPWSSHVRGLAPGLFRAPCPSLSPFLSLSPGRGAPSHAPAPCPSLSFPSQAPVAPFPSFLFLPPVSAEVQQEWKWRRMLLAIQTHKRYIYIYIKRIRNAQDISTWNILTPCAKHAHILSRLLVGASEEVLLSLMFPLENWGSWQD